MKRSPSGIAQTNDSARSAALSILCTISAGTSLSNALFENATTHLDLRDRRFTRQLVNGVLKWRKRIDWTANQFTRKPFSALPDTVANAVRLGLFQILWLDRVPVRAAVHSSVELVKRRGEGKLSGVVNAVLRRAAKEAAALPLPDRTTDPARHLSITHSHPRWLVERWLQRWGFEATERILKANNQPPRLYVRINSEHISAAEFPALFPNTPPEPCDTSVAGWETCFVFRETEEIFSSDAFRNGLFWVQDVSAGIAALLLAPRSGDRILDTCCAPGGKTVQLALEMKGRGTLIAADLSAQRLRLLRETCHRMNLGRIFIITQDAQYPALRPDAPFDGALIDVPCSSTGALARLPDARWHRRPSDLADYFNRQLAMLKSTYEVLKPNGVLVYSTCSLEPEENEDVIRTFLAQTPSARLEPARHIVTAPWADDYVQTVPGRHPGDGAFAARVRKSVGD